MAKSAVDERVDAVEHGGFHGVERGDGEGHRLTWEAQEEGEDGEEDLTRRTCGRTRPGRR